MDSKKEKAALEKVRSELRSRVSKSLNKLCDRDTQSIAVTEFTTLCEEEPLPPSLASVVVNSLISLDTKDSAFARVSVAKMFATLAGTQFAGIQPSLGKVVANLVKRTKDKDSNVRDAIGQAFGELARVLVSAGNGLSNTTTNDDTVDPDATTDSFEGGPSLGVFFKPLLQTMESAEEFSQQGCALALAHVIFSSGTAVKGHLEKLTTRIIAILGNNQFQGRKELLIAVANMVRTHPSRVARASPPSCAPCSVATDLDASAVVAHARGLVCWGVPGASPNSQRARADGGVSGRDLSGHGARVHPAAAGRPRLDGLERPQVCHRGSSSRPGVELRANL
jgi:hypothetical protein